MKWPTARITHIGLTVGDLDAAIAFFTRALGMRVMKRAAGRFATLSFGYQHHDIALLPAPPGTPRSRGLGMHHVCLDFQDYESWVRAYGRLVDAGVEIERVVDHRTGVGIYFSDPEGNNFEVWYEAFPTMEEAIENGHQMSEEFEENHIGYAVDQAQLYRDYQRLLTKDVLKPELELA
ncbi:VOC family protein [Phenylobacterium sp.]|uniref:VOC family protein n=1 Tax=Phenylobacterium sp. TaxID=1871053 RepID=UPI0035B406E6